MAIIDPNSNCGISRGNSFNFWSARVGPLGLWLISLNHCLQLKNYDRPGWYQSKSVLEGQLNKLRQKITIKLQIKSEINKTWRRYKRQNRSLGIESQLRITRFCIILFHEPVLTFLMLKVPKQNFFPITIQRSIFLPILVRLSQFAALDLCFFRSFFWSGHFGIGEPKIGHLFCRQFHLTCLPLVFLQSSVSSWKSMRWKLAIYRKICIFSVLLKFRGRNFGVEKRYGKIGQSFCLERC